ncbi:ras-related protein Rab-38 [Clarias gariepinus]|uniref:ras-related protein Rab-38 n=1 Tax=Clarias gariepinus TaxID=13013 RepID=UPI00234C31A9|nr:ras-related protein Rab-38 [Clarias gariepinus]
MQQREHRFKVLVIGDLGVGKTSIIKRYVHQHFSANYRATIGVDFALKVLDLDQDTIRVQLWDIAGQERFGNMTRVYYRDAIGAFVVFDVTRSCTFEAVRKWKEDLDDKVNVFGGNRIAAVLLANKCDQEKDDAFAKTYPRMEQFCREHGFISWFETSAKENINIDEAVTCLVRHIMASETDLLQREDMDTVSLKLDLGRGPPCSACLRP